MTIGSVDAGRQFGTRALAIGFMCLACLLFSGLDTIIKSLVDFRTGYFSTDLPILQVIWMRFLMHSVLVFAFLAIVSRGFTFLRSKRPGMQILRSSFMLGATVFNSFALRHLQLSETVTIMFLAPLIVAVVAGPLLGEWIGPRRMLAVMTGFIGVLVVMRPGTDGFHPAMLLSICGTCCLVGYNLTTRVVTGRDSVPTTLLYTTLAGSIMFAPAGISNWVSPQDNYQWMALISTGLFGALGHYFLILSHRDLPAPKVAPFMYSQMLWMVGAGYLFFGNVPDWPVALGGIIILTSGLYLLKRERAQI